jgi:hypothetical protein
MNIRSLPFLILLRLFFLRLLFFTCSTHFFAMLLALFCSPALYNIGNIRPFIYRN